MFIFQLDCDDGDSSPYLWGWRVGRERRKKAYSPKKIFFYCFTSPVSVVSLYTTLWNTGAVMAAIKTKRREGVCDPLKCSDIVLSKRHKRQQLGVKVLETRGRKSALRFYSRSRPTVGWCCWSNSHGNIWEVGGRWPHFLHTSMWAFFFFFFFFLGVCVCACRGWWPPA